MRKKRIEQKEGRLVWLLVFTSLLSMFALGSTAKAQELGLYTSHTNLSDFSITTPTTQTWPSTIMAETTALGGPLTQAQLNEAIGYAMWSWGQRTGKVFVDMGTAQGEGGSKSGRVTFLWAEPEDVEAATGKTSVAAYTRRWYYLDTGNISGVVVYLNKKSFQFGLTDCARHIVMHEWGHAIGISTHAASESDVMHYLQTQCRYALTVNDVKLAPYGQYTCHAELTRGGSLFIPAFEDMAAYLKARDGRLRLTEYVQSSGCTSVEAYVMDLYLNDVRSIDGNYSGWLLYQGDYSWAVGDVVQLPPLP